MKQVTIKQYVKASLPAFLLLFTACSKKDHSDDKPKGKLEINVGIAVSTDDIYSQIKATSTDDFKLIIYDQDENAVASFDRVADMPDLIELNEGTYHVLANSDNNIPAEFENPFYEGNSGDFIVSPSATSSVNVTCSLANIMVSVVYSDNVISDFSDYSTSISNSGGSLVFGETELRKGFFNSGPLHIEANLYYIDELGALKSKALTGNISDPQPRVHYEIRIDASVTEGAAIINLNVDENYTTEIVDITEDAGDSSVGYGDLIITEIMNNPKVMGEPYGEWIEIKNVSGNSINLKDLVIRRGSTNALHRITADIELANDEYAVFARTDSAIVGPDYVYGSSITLLNATDELFINTFGTNGIDGTIICSVTYGSAGFPTSTDGASIQLDPSVNNANDAKIGSNWCTSTQLYSVGDYGTPGGENGVCN